MIKRFLMMAMVISLASLLFASCGSQLTMEAADQGKEGLEQLDFSDIEIGEPGKIHNEILRDFDKRLSLVKSRNIDRAIFIETFMASVNRVLEENHIALELTKHDIVPILNQFDSLRTQNIIDFYGRKDMDPNKLIDWLAESGYLDATSCRKARALISQLQRIDFLNINKEICSLSFVTADNQQDLDPAIVLAAEVADSSYTFWNKLYRKNNAAMAITGEQNVLLIDWWNIELVVYDAIGAMIGTALCGAPCAIIFGAAASIIYIVATT